MLFKKAELGDSNNSRRLTLSGMTNFVKSMLVKLCTVFERKTEHLSLRTKKFYLIIFCISFVSLNIGTIINSLSHRTSVFTPRQIVLPAYIKRIRDGNMINAEPLINQNEYLRVEALKNYLESLHKNEQGNYKYDSIVRARPQLMDSIILFEHLYNSQKVK